MSDTLCRENQNNILFSVTSPLNRAVHEVTWKDIVESDRSQMTIRCMRTACWITNSTNTHSEYIILIALPQQKCLHKPPQRNVTLKLPSLQKFDIFF